MKYQEAPYRMSDKYIRKTNYRKRCIKKIPLTLFYQKKKKKGLLEATLSHLFF